MIGSIVQFTCDIENPSCDGYPPMIVVYKGTKGIIVDSNGKTQWPNYVRCITTCGKEEDVGCHFYELKVLL